MLRPLLALLLLALASPAQIPAFPGAEGFGAYATGGRGGDVYTVTSLNNSGAGTLREALETAPAGGRTIVFAVSGYIPVNSDTNFQVPSNVTIAGQTAPGDGVGLRGGRMLVNGHNTIMRHFRIRHGKNGTGGDCLNIAAGIDNTMIDHVSMMFSTDENFSFFGNAPDNFTMQYTSTSWGMERHNAGGLWDMNQGSCHHSLWAHHTTRNPKARPGLLEWINNVTFAYDTGFIMGDSQTPANWKANVIGCYYLSIPTYRFGLKSRGLSKAYVASNGQPNFHLHLDDCLYDYDDDGSLDGTDLGYDIVAGSEFTAGDSVGANRYYKSATPFTGAPAAVSVDDPLTAYKKVISSVGPLRLDAGAGSLRDELDTLLIDSVENQESIMVAKDSPVDPGAPPSNGEQHLADTYGISNNGFGTLNSTAAPLDTDGDGMPDKWELALGSDAGSQDHNAVFANNGSIITATTFFPANTPAGYTYLEEYLHFRAIPHAWLAKNTAASPPSLSVDLDRYTQGFNNGAAFTISGTYGGTVQQFAADETTPSSTGPVVVFTPTQDSHGRAGFDFNVTDADGSSWTQPFAILVEANTVYVPPPELIAWYSMEGNVIDNSGHGNDAAANGSPAYATGHIGQAIDLDGSDDFISLPGGVAESDDITVAAWVYWEGGDDWQRIFDFGNGTDEYMFLTPRNADGQMRFGFKTAAEYPNLYAPELATGVWTHVAVTLHGDTGVLYVNGTAEDTQTIVNNPSDLLPQDRYIGKSQWPANPYFDGRIDDFRIYNYALSETEIEDLATREVDLLQAEDASYGNGSILENGNAGFNGTGYVNFPTTGGHLEFTGVNGGSGGERSLDIRYALAEAAGWRIGRFIVNGVAQSIVFHSTSDWAIWNTKTLTVTLNSGTNNTIRFESSGEDLANIDQIAISEATPTPTGRYWESGGVLSMEAENGVLGGRWITGTDAGASNGGYLEVDPAYNNATGAPEGTTAEYLSTYGFHITSGGNYRFWFRIYSDNGDDDSFFWRIDGGGWNLENNGFGIGSWFSRDNTQVDSLDAGDHVLEIAYRENGTRLDKLVIQLDSLADSSGVGPPESTRAGSDSDKDGLDDAWEIAHFGNLDQIATDDPDGDGANNADELIAGTVPNDRTSILRVSGLVPDQSGWMISFPSIAGITYRIDCSDTLDPGSWVPLEDDIAGTGDTISVPDTTALVQDRRFYRIAVVP